MLGLIGEDLPKDSFQLYEIDNLFLLSSFLPSVSHSLSVSLPPSPLSLAKKANARGFSAGKHRVVTFV